MLARNYAGNLVGAAMVLFSVASARAGQTVAAESETFAVFRGDTQIGTNTINIGRNGTDTNVQIVTHVSIAMAFITLYRFDQTENEQWANGRLLTLSATTDDNGKRHRVSANNEEGGMIVEGDGQVRKAACATLPITLWNPPSLDRYVGLDPEDGSIVPVSVVDRGEDEVEVSGHAMRAHHYFIKSSYAQDVWYDDKDRLVKVQMRVTDGSTIRYELI